MHPHCHHLVNALPKPSHASTAINRQTLLRAAITSETAHVLPSCIHHGLGVCSTSSHHFSHLVTSTNSSHNNTGLEEIDHAKTQGDARKVEGQQAEVESLPRGSPQERADWR